MALSMMYNNFMKFKLSILATLLVLPAISFAQSLQAFIPDFTTFLGQTIVPFLLGIAFLIFVINTVRFFVIQSNEEEGRKKAKSLMIWSVIAFTLIIVFWGIINIIGNSIFNDKSQPTSDYMCPNGLCPEYMEPEWYNDETFGPGNPCNNPNNPECINGLIP